MKSKVNLIYIEDNKEKIFTFTYNPKSVIPEIEINHSKEMTIEGVYRFSNTQTKYTVQINTFVSFSELKEIKKISLIESSYVYYNTSNDVFSLKDDEKTLKGKLVITNIKPPQRKNHFLYEIECIFYEI